MKVKLELPALYMCPWSQRHVARLPCTLPSRSQLLLRRLLYQHWLTMHRPLRLTPWTTRLPLKLQTVDAQPVDVLDTVLAVGGILTSDEVVRTYGSSTLSVLQVQRLAYFDGALYYNMASKEEDQTESGGS